MVSESTEPSKASAPSIDTVMRPQRTAVRTRTRKWFGFATS